MKYKILTSLPLAMLAFVSFVVAHEGIDDFGHHGMMGGYYGYGMGLFGWVFMILVVVALILFIVWMIKQIQSPRRR